jgi:hypothetical protein
VRASPAWAYLGAETETREAITAATAAREAGQGTDAMYDGIGGEFGFSTAREHNWFGTALLTVGDAAASAEYNRTALDELGAAAEQEQPHLEPGLDGYARADLATAHLTTGDLDAALESLTPLWDVADTERRAALTGRLNTITAMLTGAAWRGDRGARDLRDRIESYNTAAALARALPASVP